jgi:predicted alpha/beta superfamily hydrolase
MCTSTPLIDAPMDATSATWKDYRELKRDQQHTVTGSVLVLPGFHSPELGNERDILAYLPPSYHLGDRSYPVIYMHDGQNLFDEVTSFSGEWNVDHTMDAASRSGLEAIVIGIPNAGPERMAEYSPYVDPKHGGGEGDTYLDFIVNTLKPRVDTDLRTRPDRESTGIFGSSLGALLSLYGFFHRPDVFSFAGAMSPAFWFADGAIFRSVKEAEFNPGRIYLDVGTQEGALTVRNARRMRTLLHSRGYDAGHQLTYVEERGAGHTEAAWRRRLGRSMEFLLRPICERRRAPR